MSTIRLFFHSWDQQYLLEKKNFEDIGDKGEVWFGENAMNRMVRWLEKNVDADSQIIDLGCGNGLMCLELHEAGFKNVCGVDYSAHAIELAKKLAQDSQLHDDQVQFSVSNFQMFFNSFSNRNIWTIFQETFSTYYFTGL